jgi:hypothetical protein
MSGRRFLLPLVLLTYAEIFPLCNWWQRILLYIAAAAGIEFRYRVGLFQPQKRDPPPGPCKCAE